MTIITIPQKLAKRGDMVIIPRKEYEELLTLKKIKSFKPTANQKRDLRQAINDYQKGKYLSINELKRKLAG